MKFHYLITVTFLTSCLLLGGSQALYYYGYPRSNTYSSPKKGRLAPNAYRYFSTPKYTLSAGWYRNKEDYWRKHQKKYYYELEAAIENGLSTDAPYATAESLGEGLFQPDQSYPTTPDPMQTSMPQDYQQPYDVQPVNEPYQDVNTQMQTPYQMDQQPTGYTADFSQQAESPQPYSAQMQQSASQPSASMQQAAAQTTTQMQQTAAQSTTQMQQSAAQPSTQMQQLAPQSSLQMSQPAAQSPVQIPAPQPQPNLIKTGQFPEAQAQMFTKAKFQNSPSSRICAPGPPLKPNPRFKNCLVIGDSIAIGYLKSVKFQMSNKCQVQHAPFARGSGAIDSKHGVECLSMFLKTTAMEPTHYDAIIFNFGMHDINYSKRFPEEHVSFKDYKKNLKILKQSFLSTGAKVAFALTTPFLSSKKRNERIKLYNKAAVGVMKNGHQIPVIDLYHIITKRCGKPADKKYCPIMKGPGDVHYSEEGYQLLGTRVAAAFSTMIYPQRLSKKKPAKIHPRFLTRGFLSNYATVKAITCPDALTRCPIGTTCCESFLSLTGYGCCTMPDAVSCQDNWHCCPHGSVCSPTCNVRQCHCVKYVMSSKGKTIKNKTKAKVQSHLIKNKKGKKVAKKLTKKIKPASHPLVRFLKKWHKTKKLSKSKLNSRKPEKPWKMNFPHKTDFTKTHTEHVRPVNNSINLELGHLIDHHHKDKYTELRKYLKSETHKQERLKVGQNLQPHSEELQEDDISNKEVDINSGSGAQHVDVKLAEDNEKEIEAVHGHDDGDNEDKQPLEKDDTRNKGAEIHPGNGIEHHDKKHAHLIHNHNNDDDDDDDDDEDDDDDDDGNDDDGNDKKDNYDHRQHSMTERNFSETSAKQVPKQSKTFLRNQKNKIQRNNLWNHEEVVVESGDANTSGSGLRDADDVHSASASGTRDISFIPIDPFEKASVSLPSNSSLIALSNSGDKNFPKEKGRKRSKLRKYHSSSFHNSNETLSPKQGSNGKEDHQLNVTSTKLSSDEQLYSSKNRNPKLRDSDLEFLINELSDTDGSNDDHGFDLMISASTESGSKDVNSGIKDRQTVKVLKKANNNYKQTTVQEQPKKNPDVQHLTIKAMNTSWIKGESGSGSTFDDDVFNDNEIHGKPRDDTTSGVANSSEVSGETSGHINKALETELIDLEHLLEEKTGSGKVHGSAMVEKKWSKNAKHNNLLNNNKIVENPRNENNNYKGLRQKTVPVDSSDSGSIADDSLTENIKVVENPGTGNVLNIKHQQKTVVKGKSYSKGRIGDDTIPQNIKAAKGLRFTSGRSAGLPQRTRIVENSKFESTKDTNQQEKAFKNVDVSALNEIQSNNNIKSQKHEKKDLKSRTSKPRYVEAVHETNNSQGIVGSEIMPLNKIHTDVINNKHASQFLHSSSTKKTLKNNKHIDELFTSRTHRQNQRIANYKNVNDIKSKQKSRPQKFVIHSSLSKKSEHLKSRKNKIVKNTSSQVKKHIIVGETDDLNHDKLDFEQPIEMSSDDDNLILNEYLS